MSDYLNKICPHCGGNIVWYYGLEICEKCRYTMPGPTYVTTNSTDSEINSTGNDLKKSCPICGQQLIVIDSGSTSRCPSCGYMSIITTGDSPLSIPYDDNKWSVGRISTPNLLDPCTLTIKDCKKIKLHHKEIDIDVELNENTIENIDVIIINGHKFTRSNNNG